MAVLTFLAVFGVACLIYLRFGPRPPARRLPPPPVVDPVPKPARRAEAAPVPAMPIPLIESELVRRLLLGALAADDYRAEMESLARADAERHPVVVPPDRGVQP